MGKYVIRSSSEGYYFIMVSENGMVILTSLIFQTLPACKDGIAYVKANCSLDSKYEITKSENGKFYFTLKTPNNQVIGKSEMYESVSEIKVGIDSVKRNCSSAIIIEE